MKHRKKKNSIYFVILFSLIVSISLGYSYLERNISINGLSFLSKNTWNIHFENFTVKDGSVELNEEVKLNDKSTTIDFSVELELPGDFYEFNVDVVNSGTIGASLQDFVITDLSDDVKKFFRYEVKYSDGSKVKEYDFLGAGKSVTLNVKVAYIRYEDENEVVPESDQYLDLSLTLKYVQDSGLPRNIVKRMAYLSRSDEFVNFGEEASSKNGEGVLLKYDTKNDDNPIYYYRGNVSDNNVLFANKCWKIVRTTETGGVKMIYNGLPNDKGSCDNSGEDSQLAAVKYNDMDSLVSGGYMFNNELNFGTTSNIGVVDILNFGSVGSTGYSRYYNGYNSVINYRYLYYSDSVSWNGKNYVLNSPNKTSSAFSSKGFYTCGASTSCSKVKYLVKYGFNAYSYSGSGSNSSSSNNNNSFYVELSNGQLIDDVDTIYVSEDIEFNSDSNRYTLKSPISYTLYQFVNLSNEDVLSNYYICSDYFSTSCGVVRKIDKLYKGSYRNTTNNVTYNASGCVGYEADLFSNYVFSNDVSYSDGNYFLSDTVYGLKNSGYNYTCMSENNLCTDVYYFLDTGDLSKMYFVKFSNGEKMDSESIKMFDNVQDSNVKIKVDDWFNSEMLNYKDYLEDSYWCNDRRGTGSGFNKDTNSNTKFLPYSRYNLSKVDLSCDISDSFSQSVESGNGKLQYPVGLITMDEIILSGGKFDTSYLNFGSSYWTMSPAEVGTVYYMSDKLNSSISSSSFGIRPVISLKGDAFIIGGDGSLNHPFIIK